MSKIRSFGNFVARCFRFRVAWFFLGVFLTASVAGLFVVRYVPIIPLKAICSYEDWPHTSGGDFSVPFRMEGELTSEFMKEVAEGFSQSGINFTYIQNDDFDKRIRERRGHYKRSLADFFERDRDIILITAEDFFEGDKLARVFLSRAAGIVTRKTGRPFHVGDTGKECEEVRQITIEGKIPERALRPVP